MALKISCRLPQPQAREAKLLFSMDGTAHDMGFDHVIVASGARAQALLPDTVPNLRPVKGQYIRVRSQRHLQVSFERPMFI